MTITVQTSFIIYTGNGATTAFPFAFRVDDADHLYVTLINIATAVETALVKDTDFSVTGIGDANGGTVTYPLVGSSMAATHKLRIERIVPLVQELDIAQGSSFLPGVIEQALDYMTMMIQQADAKASLDVEVFADAAALSAAEAAEDAADVEAILADISASGRVLRSGVVPPGPGDGEDGDFWIDFAAWMIYGPKAAGAWPAGVSLIGPAGDIAGPAGAVTNENPAVWDGVSGSLLKELTYAAFKNKLALVKGDVGLGNVDNTSDANKPVSTATQTALNAKEPLGAYNAENEQTGATYTFVTADAGKIIKANRATAQTFTIDTDANQPMQARARIDLYQYGAGQVTIAPAGGVTLRGGKYKTFAQYATLSLYRIAANEWLVFGNVVA